MLKFLEFEKGEKKAHYVYEEDGSKTIPWSYKLSAFEDAGLKIPNTVVVVDFDNHDNDKEIDKKLKLIIDYFDKNYPTFKVETNSGYHLYYRKPKGLSIKNWNKTTTTYGIPVDYKTGVPVAIKLNGKVRKTNMSFDELKFSELPELPLELYPIIKSKNINMLGMSVGERDSSLFNHLLNVKETIDNIELSKVANFINNYLFLEPLDEKQIKEKLDNIKTREKKEFDNYTGDPKDMISFAEFIVKKLDIKIYHSQLYFKDGLNYSKDKIKLNKAINKYLKLKRSQMTELDAQLYIYAELINPRQKFNVKLQNGVIVDDTVVDYDCGFTPFYLDVRYDSNAYDENVDNFLDFLCCDRKDMRIVLEEILGHILLVDKFPHKIFFLTGSGANGKSTFVEMITKWTGELSSHVDIANFDDGTSLASLVGKLVNVADDVDAIYLEKSKNLKTMASGNTVGTRAIYSQPIDLKNTATLIFTANEPPVFKDKSDGIGRRLVIIPFENKVKERNYNLDELLSSDNAKSYLLNLALDGMRRIYNNKLEISDSTTIKEATKQYYLDNDSVMAYLNEYPDINGKRTDLVYGQYAGFCEATGRGAYQKSRFTSRLKDFGYIVKPTYKKEEKKTIRCYVKV